MNKKAQGALEFIILTMALLFFFLSLVLVFQQEVAKKTFEKRTIEAQEIALTVQNEINIASEASDGYTRQFEIPQSVINLNYTILVTEGIVFVETEDKKHALALSTKNVTGQIQKGANIIQKINNTIYLNI